MRKRGWRWAALLGAVILCVVIALLAWYYLALRPVSTSTKNVPFVIERGESLRTVAADLEKQGLIRSATAFSIYYQQHRSQSAVQAGRYILSPNMAPADMFQDFITGKVLPNGVSVTIPEGYNITEIATRLQDAGICSRKAFVDAEEHANFTQPFLSGLNKRSGIRYRLEGFLFPDTYQFQLHEPPVDLINEMLNNFQSRVLTPTTVHQLQTKHMTLNEVLTKASLIENEAQVDSERPIIASVIDNRLKQGMKLQIDATVEYALGHHVSIVTNKDTVNTHSPYNTYLVTGLPPGPIDSPGEKSIQAALNPSVTSYLYYVTKGDGSGEHYFSKTYSQQLHNEQLFANNLRKSGE